MLSRKGDQTDAVMNDSGKYTLSPFPVRISAKRVNNNILPNDREKAEVVVVMESTTTPESMNQTYQYDWPMDENRADYANVMNACSQQMNP